MAHFTSKKLAVVGKQGFKVLDATWLLIYDNWPAPALDHGKARILGCTFVETHSLDDF